MNMDFDQPDALNRLRREYLKRTSKLQPDFGRFRKAVLRDGAPDRIPLAEYYYDYPILTALLGEEPLPAGPRTPAQVEQYRRQIILFHRAMGMDFVMAGTGFYLPKKREQTSGTDKLVATRSWVSESEGPITCEADFDRYPWPNPADPKHYAGLEFMCRNLPEGMKVVVNTGGPFEEVRELMGFETLALALYEKPGLVEQLFERVGPLLMAVHRHVVEIDGVGAIHMGDDMSYKQGPMIAPDMLRQYVFPWHQRYAANAHAHDLPFTLHSDGNNDAIMNDLIDTVKIDGKHAFEDAAQPVEEVKRKYGNRLALIGGMDVDFLCRTNAAALRKRVHSMLEICGAGGGYAFGTGSGLTTFATPERCLFMYNEALDWMGIS